MAGRVPWRRSVVNAPRSQTYLVGGLGTTSIAAACAAGSAPPFPEGVSAGGRRSRCRGGTGAAAKWSTSGASAGDAARCCARTRGGHGAAHHTHRRDDRAVSWSVHSLMGLWSRQEPRREGPALALVVQPARRHGWAPPAVGMAELNKRCGRAGLALAAIILLIGHPRPPMDSFYYHERAAALCGRVQAPAGQVHRGRRAAAEERTWATTAPRPAAVALRPPSPAAGPRGGAPRRDGGGRRRGAPGSSGRPGP